MRGQRGPRMATRIKSDRIALITIIDWPAADSLIRELGEIQSRITEAEGKATADINKIKEALETKVNQLHDRQKYIVKSLEEFALGHTKDFGDARSRKLDYGTIGWRASTVIEIAATTLERIKEYLTSAEQKACIRIKETVDKEALAKLKDEKLAIVKARRKTKDVFFVEPLLTEAADKTE
jgi:phage host-nuclease inhibitor protein Gam